MARPGSADDLVLRDGDVLYITQLQSTVKISGIVTYPNSVTYTRNMSVRIACHRQEDIQIFPVGIRLFIYMNGKVSYYKKVVFFFKKISES